MAADWREAANSEMDTMMNKANLSRRFSKVIVGLHSIAVVCFGIEVLVSHTDDYDADGMETPVRAFTLKLQRPLQFNESPLYEIVVCLEFLHQLASSAVTGVLNCLLITLVSAIYEKKICFLEVTSIKQYRMMAVIIANIFNSLLLINACIY
jgi:hypothetical protein